MRAPTLPAAGARWSRWFAVATVGVGLAAVATGMGAVIALGSLPLTLLMGGAIGGALLLFVPTAQLAWAQVVMSFIVAGVAMYYGKVAQAHWMPYALATWMWLKLPIDRAMAVAPPHQRLAAAASAPSTFTWLFIAWAVAAALTSVANQTPPLSVLVGARSHLFIWSLAFVLAAGVLGATDLRRAVLALLAVAALQMPFAVQQHFMNFGSIGSWDAVVGTFGGDPEGGGASGAMVIYQAIALGLIASLARWGELRALPAAGLAAAVLLSIALAEVKAFFVFAPVMLGAVFMFELRERPMRALAMGLVGVLAIGALFIYYKQTYFDAQRRSAQEASAAEYLDYMTSADSRLSLINRYTGEVSRLGAPLLWAEESGRDGFTQQLTGYGLRASRTGGLLGMGEAARRFPFNLTTSAVTVLLWETGLLGLALFTALLLALAALGWRLSREPGVPRFHRAVLEAVPPAMAVLLASMFYNDAVVNHYTIQTLLAFLAGYALYWRRHVLAQPAARVAEVPARHGPRRGAPRQGWVSR